MDELGAHRLERSRRRLPEVETIVAMFATRLEARFKVVPELVTEARRRIREGTRIFGRSVQTKVRAERRSNLRACASGGVARVRP